MECQESLELRARLGCLVNKVRQGIREIMVNNILRNTFETIQKLCLGDIGPPGLMGPPGLPGL